jgi:hypothetical protein
MVEAKSIHRRSDSAGKGQHFGLGGTEEFLDFGNVRHAGALKGGFQLRGGQRFLAQQEVNVIEIILITARHFREDEVESGGTKDFESVKFERDGNAPREPVRRQDDLHFAEKVRDVKSFGLQFPVSALLGVPEIKVVIASGEPR